MWRLSVGRSISVASPIFCLPTNTNGRWLTSCLSKPLLHPLRFVLQHRGSCRSSLLVVSLCLSAALDHEHRPLNDPLSGSERACYHAGEQEDDPDVTGTQDETFGTLLRRYREAAGFTQEDLAQTAGLSANAVSQLERGLRRRPYPHTVRALADALVLSEQEMVSLLASVPKRGATASLAMAVAPVLPDPLTLLVGRERDMVAAASLLESDDTRLVTLVGPGGVGKTRLALAVAGRIGDGFPDGVAFVALASVTDPNMVVPSVARALGLREAGSLPASELVHRYLRDKRLLLVLDNFEHLLKAVPEVATLLASCPSLNVLATSRAPLRLRGEQEYYVEPLAVPDTSGAPDVRGVAGSPAGQLFLSRARQANPHFSLTDRNAAAVAAICGRLGGLPLALELAAAKVRFLSPTELLSRLDEVLRSGGARDLPERQRTLRATLDWSYDLLREPERALFRRLSVFAGGFSLEAAQAAGGAEEDSTMDALGVLESLVEQSLVTVEPDTTGDSVRYGMLEPVRHYALEKLAEAGEEEQAHERYARYYEALAQRAEPELRGPDQAQWLNLLEEENSNLRAVLAWTTRNRSEELGLRIATSLRRFWSVRGYLEEGHRWLETALASCPASDPSPRAEVLRGLGEMTLEQGEPGRAIGLFEESLALERRLGNKAGVASALQGLGEAILWRGDHMQAALLCKESVTLRREAGDRQGLAMSLNALGLVKIQQGDHERALALLEEGLALAQEVEDVWVVAVNLDNLGWANLGRSDLERSARSFGGSLRLYRELGEKWLAADCLDGLARVASAQGNPVRAARLWGAAQSLCEAIGATTTPLDQAAYERHLAAACTSLGEVAFTAAWAKGRVMEPEEAVAEALSEDA